MSLFDLPNEIITTIILAADDPREMYLAAMKCCTRTRDLMKMIIARIAKTLGDSTFAKFKSAKKVMFYEFAAIVTTNYNCAKYNALVCWHMVKYERSANFIRKFYNGKQCDGILYTCQIIGEDGFSERMLQHMRIFRHIYSDAKQNCELSFDRMDWVAVNLNIFACVNFNNFLQIFEASDTYHANLYATSGQDLRVAMCMTMLTVITMRINESRYYFNDINPAVVKHYRKKYEISDSFLIGIANNTTYRCDLNINNDVKIKALEFILNKCK